jgi:uncharacterized heparinase superfamily protein
VLKSQRAAPSPFRTLRALGGVTGKQIAYRLYYTVRRYWWRRMGTRPPSRTAPYRTDFRGTWKKPESFSQFPEAEPEIEHRKREAAKIACLRFEFLGRAREFGDKVDWNAAGEARLWRFHLHYFEYTGSLLFAGEAGYATFRRLALDWIENNTRLSGDGWHPYTISLRLPNWLQAKLVWSDRMATDRDFEQRLLASIHAQAAVLRSSLELDLRGNHLLENLRTLLWAGLAFEGKTANSWYETAFGMLQREAEEQVLADGGHFERTPSYHVAVLRLYVDVAILLERHSVAHPAWLRLALSRLATFLQTIRGSENRLPLLKDSAGAEDNAAEELLFVSAALLDDPSVRPAARGGLVALLLLGPEKYQETQRWTAMPAQPGLYPLKETGYYVFRGSREFIVVDMGKLAPDYLPGHAHADTFTFEYSFNGRPVIVDSGVFEYEAGKWRDYFRSTRAHNTVELDGENSSEVWGGFRVGRRARVSVRTSTGDGRNAWLMAEHDGYRFLPGSPVHRRCVLWSAEKYLCVVDLIENGPFEVARNHVHFHPDVTVSEIAPTRCKLSTDAGDLWVTSTGTQSASIVCGQELPRVQGWYSEHFGVRRANAVLSFEFACRPSSVMGYMVSPLSDSRIELENQGDGVHVALYCGSSVERYRITKAVLQRYHPAP